MTNPTEKIYTEFEYQLAIINAELKGYKEGINDKIKLLK